MLVSKKWTVLSGAALSALSVSYASALSIYGTTPYSNSVPGYTGNTATVASGGPIAVGTGGVAVGNGRYWFSPPSTNYTTGWILTSSGTITLGLPAGQPAGASGGTPTVVKSIDTNGTLITGLSQSYEAPGGSSYTNNETVWNTAGVAISLPAPVTNSLGTAPNVGSGLINNLGTVVGSGTVYNPSTTSALATSGAFVWTNSGTVGSPSYTSYSELLAPNNSTGVVATGLRSESVSGISDSGLAVGTGSTYSGSTATGFVAVTRDTTQTPTPAATTGTTQTTIASSVLTLPVLPATGFGTGPYSYTSASGTGTAVAKTTASANYVNASNVIAGSAVVYNASSAAPTTGNYTSIGYEPIVWSGPSATGTFLPFSSSSYNQGNVTGLNALGDAIGSESNTGLQQAVLWTKASSYAATVLAAPTGTNPLTSSAYTSYTNVKGVNDADYSVGFLGSSTGDSTGTNALLWSPTGSVTDLNTLITETTVASGNAGWVSLLAADSISDDGWITGVGVYYDPTATGYSTAALGSTPGEYYRQFLIQDTAVVPEPASLATLVVVAAAGTLRGRRSRRVG